MTYNICSDVIRWQIPDFISDGKNNVCFTVCEIFTKQAKRKNFDLEKEGQGQAVEERDLRLSTRNIRIGEFFGILDIWKIRLCKRQHTHL